MTCYRFIKQIKMAKKKDIEKIVNEAYKVVYEYPTKNKQGFIYEEIEELLKKYPKINRDKFNEAMWGNTCMMVEGKLVMYHCDVFKALQCGIENRNLTLGEWD